MKDIEPKVLRQRLIIEGLLDGIIRRAEIDKYLIGLSEVSGMKITSFPTGIFLISSKRSIFLRVSDSLAIIVSPINLMGKSHKIYYELCKKT